VIRYETKCHMRCIRGICNYDAIYGIEMYMNEKRPCSSSDLNEYLVVLVRWTFKLVEVPLMENGGNAKGTKKFEVLHLGFSILRYHTRFLIIHQPVTYTPLNYYKILSGVFNSIESRASQKRSIFSLASKVQIRPKNSLRAAHTNQNLSK
jgi:hypothetical protein